MIYRKDIKCDVFKFQKSLLEIKENFRYQKGVLKQKPHFSILRNGAVCVQVMATSLLSLA
jgi:hypothetical protein